MATLNPSLPALKCKSESKEGNILFKIISQRPGRVSLEISNSKTNWIPNDSLGDVFLFVGDKRTLVNLILVSKQFYHLLNNAKKGALLVQELKRRFPVFTLGYDLKSKNLSFFQIHILKYIEDKLKTAKLIQDPEEKATALRYIAKEQAMVDVNEAKKTFVLAIKAANLIKARGNKALALKDIAIEQAKVDVKGAINTANLIQDIYCKADALRGIALEQAKVDLNEAKKTFVLAIKTAKLIQYSRTKAIALKRIAKDMEGGGCFNW